MTLVYALKLGFQVSCTNIKAQKIDGSIFKTFEIVLASFQMEDKLGKAWFFLETFLLADTSIEMMLKMSFLNFRNANMSFSKQKLI